MSGVDETNEDFSKAMDDLKKDIKKYENVINGLINNIDAEVWIGKKDRFVHKIKIKGEFDKEFIEMLENEMAKNGDVGEENLLKGLDVSVVFSADINMTNFNQPVEITEPKETEDLMKVLEEAMQKIVPSPIYDNSEIKNDSDGDGLSDALEDIYKTDKNNPDTDGDGYLDGNEVENGYDPLVPGSAKLDYGKMFEEKK